MEQLDDVSSPQQYAPLFEHFLVIGPSHQAIIHKTTKNTVDGGGSPFRSLGGFAKNVSEDRAMSVGSTRLSSSQKLSVLSGSMQASAGRLLTQMSSVKKLLSSSAAISDDKKNFSSDIAQPPAFQDTKGPPQDPSESKESSNCNNNSAPCTSSDSMQPSVLYQFPGGEGVASLPQELVDFCLPIGCRVRRVKGADISEDCYRAELQELLLGSNCNRRTGGCFVFLVEDKTKIHTKAIDDEEDGFNVINRLYGVCVTLNRIVPSSAAVSPSISWEAPDLEATICYAFVTRFPFFDFFFEILFCLISAERTSLIEAIAIAQSTVKNAYSLDSLTLARGFYSLVNHELMDEIMCRLLTIKPPHYGESVIFSLPPSPTKQPLLYTRTRPSRGVMEWTAASAEWALPVLLHWLPIEAVVWAVGLLLCEVKMLITGSEPGIVSCGVFGLLSLLRPLRWSAPLISMLPAKHVGFVESPVPILAGVLLEEEFASSETDNSIESKDPTITVQSLLERCNESGMPTAIIDMKAREIFISGVPASSLHELLLPGAEPLVDKLKELLSPSGSFSSTSSVASSASSECGWKPGPKGNPSYTFTSEYISRVSVVSREMQAHIRAITEMTNKRCEEKALHRQPQFMADMAQSLEGRAENGTEISLGLDTQAASETPYDAAVSALASPLPSLYAPCGSADRATAAADATATVTTGESPGGDRNLYIGVDVNSEIYSVAVTNDVRPSPVSASGDEPSMRELAAAEEPETPLARKQRLSQKLRALREYYASFVNEDDSNDKAAETRAINDQGGLCYGVGDEMENLEISDCSSEAGGDQDEDVREILEGFQRAEGFAVKRGASESPSDRPRLGFLQTAGAGLDTVASMMKPSTSPKASPINSMPSATSSAWTPQITRHLKGASKAYISIFDRAFGTASKTDQVVQSAVEPDVGTSSEDITVKDTSSTDANIVNTTTSFFRTTGKYPAISFSSLVDRRLFDPMAAAIHWPSYIRSQRTEAGVDDIISLSQYNSWEDDFEAFAVRFGATQLFSEMAGHVFTPINTRGCDTTVSLEAENAVSGRGLKLGVSARTAFFSFDDDDEVDDDDSCSADDAFV